MNNLHRSKPLLLAFFFTLLAAIGCRELDDPLLPKPTPPPPPPPVIVSCFSLQNDTFMDPKVPVQFLNCSQGATTYLWHFGDSATSDSFEPAHQYADTGHYTVRLEAFLGDYKEEYSRVIRVDYPRFKKIRIVQMAVLDHWGLPYDPDGSGLDINARFTRDGNNSPTFIFPIAQNVTLPYEFILTQDMSIDAYFWQWELDCYGSGTRDTVGLGTIYYRDLIDSPVETRSWDSNLVEIIMEGAR
jgi:hypothetical protein